MGGTGIAGTEVCGVVGARGRTVVAANRGCSGVTGVSGENGTDFDCRRL